MDLTHTASKDRVHTTAMLWGLSVPRKSWLHAAGKIWPKLTQAAERHEFLHYGDLAPLIPTNPLNVGRALGPIQTYCLDRGLPPLTAIVVNKGKNTPGGGYIATTKEDWEHAVAIVRRFDWLTEQNPFSSFDLDDSDDVLIHRLLSNPDSAETIYRMMPSRGIAQRLFREALLKAYDHQCAMCGLTFPCALEAAHIVPWVDATPQQRMDLRNGFILCSTHHRLFDDGWFDIDQNFQISYTDVAQEEEPYSEADNWATLKIHGTTLLTPKHANLAPAFRARKIGST